MYAVMILLIEAGGIGWSAFFSSSTAPVSIIHQDRFAGHGLDRRRRAETARPRASAREASATPRRRCESRMRASKRVPSSLSRASADLSDRLQHKAAFDCRPRLDSSATLLDNEPDNRETRLD